MKRIMRISKLLMISMFTMFLFGCEVGSQAPGVWYGVAVDEQGSTEETAVLINENGDIYISLKNGLFLYSEGHYVIQGDITEVYAYALSNIDSTDFISINKDVTIDIAGQLGDENGTIELLKNGAVLYTLSLMRSADPIAPQSEFQGIWRFNPHDPDAVDTWTINANGIIKGSDPIGCNYTGHVAALTSVNMANLTLIVDSCEYEGAYHGVMSLFHDPNSDRVGIFYNFANSDYIFVNGLEKQPKP